MPDIIWLPLRDPISVTFQIIPFEKLTAIQSWVFTGWTDVEAETPILWPPGAKSWLIWILTNLKRPWCWERLRAGGEGDDRKWDGWMASPTQWTWVWVNSGSWWWTGRPGVLRLLGSQRVRRDWVTELNWVHMKAWYNIDYNVDANSLSYHQ